MSRYGIPVETGHGTWLTVEFDTLDEAMGFRSRLAQAGRLHVEMIVAADAVEHVAIHLPEPPPEPQPIVRLASAA